MDKIRDVETGAKCLRMGRIGVQLHPNYTLFNTFTSMGVVNNDREGEGGCKDEVGAIGVLLVAVESVLGPVFQPCRVIFHKQ